MKKMQCELCGSIDIMKVAPDVFQCQHCGCKYTLEQAKTLISGTVEITKGTAELERLLANAEAQIRFGAYAKAEEIYKDLVDEFPGEHKAWAKFHECKRNALLSGVSVLDHQELSWLSTITRNACISAASEEERTNFLADTEAFWQQYVMADYTSAKPMIHLVSSVRFMYEMVIGYGKKPEECIDRNLWDYIVMQTINDINKGKILIYTSDYQKSDKAIFYMQADKIEDYITGIGNLGRIHPLFEKMVQTGYDYARKLNAAKVRIAHNYGTMRESGGPDREYVWLPAGNEEIKELYVDMKWVYGPYAFGEDYYLTNYDYLAKKYRTKTKQLLVLDGMYAAMTQNRKPENDLREWNYAISCCPFCGAHDISDGLFGGRKCRVCKKPIPRFK